MISKGKKKMCQECKSVKLFKKEITCFYLSTQILLLSFLFLSCDTRPPNTYLYEILINNPEKWNEEKKKTNNFIMPRDKKILKKVFVGLDFSKVIFADIYFEEVKFINCNFDKSVFNTSEFNKVSFDKSSLNKSQWDSTKLKNVTFINSNLKELNFSWATLEDVVFDNVTLHHGNFASITIRNVIMKNSMLNVTTMNSPKEVKGLVIYNSDLNRAYWRILIDVDITINNSIFCNLGDDLCEKTGTNTKDWNNKYYKKIK